MCTRRFKRLLSLDTRLGLEFSRGSTSVEHVIILLKLGADVPYRLGLFELLGRSGLFLSVCENTSGFLIAFFDHKVVRLLGKRAAGRRSFMYNHLFGCPILFILLVVALLSPTTCRKVTALLYSAGLRDPTLDLLMLVASQSRGYHLIRSCRGRVLSVLRMPSLELFMRVHLDHAFALCPPTKISCVASPFRARNLRGHVDVSRWRDHG